MGIVSARNSIIGSMHIADHSLALPQKKSCQSDSFRLLFVNHVGCECMIGMVFDALEYCFSDKNDEFLPMSFKLFFHLWSVFFFFCSNTGFCCTGFFVILVYSRIVEGIFNAIFELFRRILPIIHVRTVYNTITDENSRSLFFLSVQCTFVWWGRYLVNYAFGITFSLISIDHIVGIIKRGFHRCWTLLFV